MSGYINLNIQKMVEIDREEDPNEEYDGEDITNWIINNICSFSEKSIGEYSIPTSENIKSKDTVYILYAIYSSNDSFCCNIDSDLELILSSFDLGYLIKIQIEILKSNNNPNIRLSLKNNKKMNFYKPWNGFHESLTDIRIKEVIVK